MGIAVVGSDPCLQNSGESVATMEVRLASWRMKTPEFSRGGKRAQQDHTQESEQNNMSTLGHEVLGVSLKDSTSEHKTWKIRYIEKKKVTYLTASKYVCFREPVGLAVWDRQQSE